MYIDIVTSVADPGCRFPDPGSRIPDPKTKNYRTFYPKICHLALKNIGLGSGIRNMFFPDQKGGKKAPDPGSGSATMIVTRTGI